MMGAAVVGIIHMSAPDHWMTLCLLAKNKRWTPKKLFRTSLVTAIGHVVLSIVIGLAVMAVGLLVSRSVSSYIDIGIGIIMIAIGIVLGAVPLLRKSGYHKHDHEHEHGHNHMHEHGHTHNHEKKSKLSQKLGYFIIIGAALSPDPSIIPIYLTTISSGFYFAFELSVVFAVASILTLLFLVQLGNVGLGKTFARVPEKYHDSMVGFVIAAIGIYILVSGNVG